MIFDTIAALADYRNNKRFDNSATREQCEAVVKEFMIANHERLVIGEKILLNDESKKWGYWVDGIQVKTPRADNELYVSNLLSSSSSSLTADSSSSYSSSSYSSTSFSSTSNSFSSSCSCSSLSSSSSNSSSNSVSSSSNSMSSSRSSSSDSHSSSNSLSSSLSNSLSSTSSSSGVVWSPPANNARWYYGNNTVDGKWKDFSAATDHLTLHGNASLDADGLTVDGNGDYAINTTPWNKASGFTLCCWVRYANNPSVHVNLVGIMDGYAGNYSKVLALNGDGDMNAWYVKDSDGQVTNTGSEAMNTNTWYHVAMTAPTYSGPFKYLYTYIDGVYKSAAMFLGESKNNFAVPNIVIGGKDSATFSDFNGEIDDVMIFDRQLTVSEILDIRDNSPAKKK